MENVKILAIGYALSILKLMYDYYRYLDDVAQYKDKMNGYLYHIFEFIIFVFSFYFGASVNLDAYGYMVLFFGFTLTYQMIVSVGFNLLRRKNLQEIGKTDITDVLIRRIFKIYDVNSDEFKAMSAKKQQINNFKKSVVLILRIIMFVVGSILIANI